MLNPERDVVDLHNPKWKKRTKRFWRGNHHGCNDHKDGMCRARFGWQVCFDSQRTNGNLGQLMPIVIDHPVSGQFKTVYTVKEIDQDGDEIETQMHKWEVKGWRPPEEAEHVKPHPLLIEALTETCLAEKRRDLESKNIREAEIKEECDALRTLIHRANGLEDPEDDVTVAIKEERKRKRTRRKAQADG